MGLGGARRPGSQLRVQSQQAALDGSNETVPAIQLRGPVSSGHEITWMVVPLGMESR